jgi:predicted TIM-barrel fold metal-dependent hydrolase
MADATRPSAIFRRNLFGCFIYDDAGLANIDRIGEDNIMFEGDYPHSDSNWPHSREMLAKSLADVPDDVARKIAEGNARRVFDFPRT